MPYSDPAKGPVTPYYEEETLALYNADCLDMLPIKVDAVITDPPYNVSLEYGEGTNDARSDYAEWCSEWFSHLRGNCDLIALTPGIANVGLWTRIAGDPDWILSWHKPGAKGRCAVGFNNWEPVLLWGKSRGGATADVLRAPLVSNDPSLKGHPCPKPAQWGTKLVSMLTKPGDTVLDPFFGTGTIPIACKLLGRRAIGIEIEPRYCDMAVRRLGQEVLAVA